MLGLREGTVLPTSDLYPVTVHSEPPHHRGWAALSRRGPCSLSGSLSEGCFLPAKGLPFWIISARLGWAKTLATRNTMSAFLGLTRSVRRARLRKPTKSLVYISRFSCTKGALGSEAVHQGLHHPDQRCISGYTATVLPDPGSSRASGLSPATASRWVRPFPRRQGLCGRAQRVEGIKRRRGVRTHVSGEQQGDSVEKGHQLFPWESNPGAQSKRGQPVPPALGAWWAGAHHLSDTARGWQSLLGAGFSGAYLQGCR